MNMLSAIKAKLAKAHRSWTVWFNGMVGAAVSALPFAQDNLPQLQGYVPAHLYQYAMAAVIVGNIILRFKTAQGLESK